MRTRYRRGEVSEAHVAAIGVTVLFIVIFAIAWMIPVRDATIYIDHMAWTTTTRVTETTSEWVCGYDYNNDWGCDWETSTDTIWRGSRRGVRGQPVVYPEVPGYIHGDNTTRSLSLVAVANNDETFYVSSHEWETMYSGQECGVRYNIFNSIIQHSCGLGVGR